MHNVIKFLIPFVVWGFVSCSRDLPRGNLKEESLSLLRELTDALIGVQIQDVKDPDYGALKCSACDVLHTRAAEAVFPFAVMYKLSHDEKYLKAVFSLGEWLIRQQNPDGSWYETPETWTGTTTDQLLMFSAAFQIIRDSLSDERADVWRNTVKKAADYLASVMRPEFASINYCATTTASLVFAFQVVPDDVYIKKARLLARQVVAKMDEAGFITGEGGRIRGVKFGVDPGYDLDMSLWGLTIYARFTGDEFVEKSVRNALPAHLAFIYPDGSMDNSWGIRSNKWTTYGSLTADGCQILFSLFSEENDLYRTAALRNLHYLRKMTRNGWVGYGPMHKEVLNDELCIYPTFTRAENLALTIEYGDSATGNLPHLPSDETGWIKHFKTVDVALVRTENFMATVTAYRYKDLKRGAGSKYMHRPAGGSVSNLWVENYGFLQISSQTEYNRWEMHFPDVNDVRCLTPRIEFHDNGFYYTNLYEFDAGMEIAENSKGMFEVKTGGELKDRNLMPGGIAYRWNHIFSDEFVEHEVKLRFHGRKREVSVIEPFVFWQGMDIRRIGENSVEISAKGRKFIFEILEGDVRLTAGEESDRWWFPIPAIRSYPLKIIVDPPENGYVSTIRYRIRLIN